jgi:hypothetical protein
LFGRLEQLKQELDEKRLAFEQERLEWERMNNVTMGESLGTQRVCVGKYPHGEQLWKGETWKKKEERGNIRMDIFNKGEERKWVYVE